MPAPFDDIKPFPGDHHNEPPLDARVTLDFDDALRAKGLDARVAEIMRSADNAPLEIISAEEAGKAADLIAMARDAKQAVEAERETLNRPLLIAQRSLKARADSIVAPMEAAVAVVRGKLDSYCATADAPALGDYGAKASAREAWDFEVVDYPKALRALRDNASIRDAVEKAVRSQVRSGVRRIPGVRIFPTTKASVR
jgi:hypothetical protein